MSRGGTRILNAPLSPLNLQEVDPFKPARARVAILGGAQSSLHGAPLDSEEWEVWGCNDLPMCLTPQGHFRADRWFEMHPRAIADDERLVTRCPAALCYVLSLREWEHRHLAPYIDPTQGAVFVGAEAPLPSLPLYSMIETWVSDAPKAAEYPLDRVHNYYFACTFAYQVALATAMQYETIGLWGVDLLFGREGVVEKASLAYHLGIAVGKGIKLYLPRGTATLWHPGRYGYDYWRELEEVGAMVRATKSTLCTIPDRPPGARPPESFTAEHEANQRWPRMPRWEQMHRWYRKWRGARRQAD